MSLMRVLVVEDFAPFCQFVRSTLACIIHPRWNVSRTVVGSEGESRS